ncbi:MAG TPA: thioredoxin family protein [Thermoanaerobaculia bacterium]|nr:thioredoxin family protein [Thermoanaerobaculia bacterium]
MTTPALPRLRLAAALAAAVLASLPMTAQVTAQMMVREEKAELALAADRTAYEAGETARVAARVTVEEEWHVNSNTPTFDYLIPTKLDLELPAGWVDETVRYPEHKMQTFSFAEQPLAVYDGELAILAQVKVPAGTKNGAVPVRASLRYQACNDSQCLPPVTTEATISLTVGPGGTPIASELFGAEAPPGDGDGPSNPGRGLGVMLLLAALGGLILNAMPCVLPVLSLKVFGLVRSAGHGRSEVVRGALATAAGILVSFLALALAAIAAKAAGAAVGWGIQFQRPGFVAFLAVVVILFCLNLWGLFEIPLPQRLARLGGSGPREGLAGHFASGLFATLMATPCSAPFLGTAVGFALGQEAPAILAIFTAVGLGMALPYLLLAAAPGAARLFPRPGAWMDTVRGVMGFLLAAAAVWLFYVLSSQISLERLAAIQLGLLALSLFLWLRHRHMFSGSPRNAMRWIAEAGVIAAVALTVGIAAVSPLSGSDTRFVEATPGLIDWEPWDRARAESLASGGKLVFVDVTADWCFTCKVNERLILETPEVAGAFEEHGVVPMKADWTNRNDEIGKFLAEHGRYGIPFYMLYRPGQEPRVFSELLSKEGLMEAVQVAASVAQR